MIVLLVFSGIALSIVQANSWFIVPDFCINLCYIMSVYAWMTYLYEKGLHEKLIKKMKTDKEKEE